MDAESKFWVRVLLLDNVTACKLKTNSPVNIITADLNAHTQPSYSRLGPFRAPTRLALSAGKLTIAGKPPGAAETTVSPDKPHIFNLNGNDYRGKLKLIVNPDGQSFDVINLVPLEPYLAGVVGAEMPDYWEPEALKAQAIVARTYCLYIKNRFGRNREWDLSRTQASQVYLGLKGESAQIWHAVNNTSGQVLLCEHVDRSKDLFPTYYSSVCGGHTEPSSNVFGDSFGPLVGVVCPYCKGVAKLGLFYWPMAKFDRTMVTTTLLGKYPKLEHLGEIAHIVAAERSDYGEFSRLTRIELIGSTGKSDFLRAEDLRLTIDPTGRKLKSAICHIVKWGDQWAFVSGRGWGHGVGMCQCGAEGMARKGKTAEQILSHYYPGSWIERVY